MQLQKILWKLTIIARWWYLWNTDKDFKTMRVFDEMEFSAEMKKKYRRMFYVCNFGKSVFITLYNLTDSYLHYSFLFLLKTFKMVKLMHP